MLSRVTLIIISLLCLSAAPDPPPASQQTGYQLITPTLLQAHLNFLASDELEGRETAKRGQRLAARYIAAQFERLGLKPLGDSGTFFQKFWVREKRLGSNSKIAVTTHSPKLDIKVWDKMFDDFYFNPRNYAPIAEVQESVVFVGYGVDDEKTFGYSDYTGIDPNGRIILMLGGEPKKLSRDGKPTRWSDERVKYFIAASKTVAAVLIVADLDSLSLKAQTKDYMDRLANSQMELVSSDEKNVPRKPVTQTPLVFISSEIANHILAASGNTVQSLKKRIDDTRKPTSFEIKGATMSITLDVGEEVLPSENVCAILEGSDPLLKNEAMVYSAHYDHVGIGVSGAIYNGADDDGSGTSGILALAEAFVKNNIRPKRSIIFMTVSGEEKGLLGSKHFTLFPTFALDKIVANVNIDMIGRVDKKYTALNNPNYIYVIGADKISKDLDRIVTEQNKASVNLTLDYTYNDDNDPNRFYYRSDHYNFAKNGIPAVFFFNGTHDDYHEPTDDVEKINFEKMSRIVKLAFAVGWEISNRAKPLKKHTK